MRRLIAQTKFPPVIPAPAGTQTDDVRSRSVVRPAILLLLRDHESHGYELIGRLVELGLSVAPTSGALYRLLYTMADEGLITSYWSTPKHGPARRVYAITGQGEQHLEASMATLASLTRTVRVMLNRYRSGMLSGGCISLSNPADTWSASRRHSAPMSVSFPLWEPVVPVAPCGLDAPGGVRTLRRRVKSLAPR